MPLKLGKTLILEVCEKKKKRVFFKCPFLSNSYLWQMAKRRLSKKLATIFGTTFTAPKN